MIVSVNEEVTLFRPAYFQGTPIRSDDPLSPLDISLLVPDQIPDLDDVTGNVVVQNLHSLCDGNTSGKQLDHVSGFKDDVWIECFAGRAHGHRAVYQVKGASNSLHGWFKSPHNWPGTE
jgi:hypothetical protein